MNSNSKPRWLAVLGIIGILIVFERLAVGYYSPPSCTPTCGSYTGCSPGSVNNPGGLTKTNATVCVGGSIGAPALTNTTFNPGQKSRTCTRSDCSTYPDYAPINYTATNWWEPANPATYGFNATGIYYFTNKVRGITTDTDCPASTAITNAGIYTVTVTNAPPIITAQPVDQVAAVGSNAVFSVTAVGCPSQSYQWRFNITNVLAGMTNAILTLTNVQMTNAGYYSVVITNCSGTIISSNALLTVSVALTIIQQPTNVVVIYGQNASFVVLAAGTAPLGYQWKRNGTNLPGANASRYEIAKPAVADSGAVYSVLVTNAYSSLTSSNAMLTVLRAPLTIRADNKARLYGVTNPPLTWSAVGFAYSDGTNVLSGAPQLGTTATNNSNAGTYPITVATNGMSSANYYFIPQPGWLSVAKVPLAITAGSKSRTYGAANPALSWTAGGFVNGDTTNVLSGAPQISTVATNNSPVGTYPIVITIGTLSASNYSFVPVNGTLTINMAALTVTANNASRLYGAPNPVFTASYSGWVNGETASVLGSAPALTTAAVSNSPVGTYVITNAMGTLNAANYYFASFNNGTLTVTKAPLTVLADNKTMYVGETVPLLTWTFSGLVAGDAPAGIGGAPTLSTASSNQPAGTYTITNNTSTLAATNNYSFISSNGVLTILPPSSQIILSNSSVNYLLGGPPTIMDGNMTVIARGTAGFSGAKLTASFVSSQSDDHLSVLDVGTGTNQISVTNATSGPDPYVIGYGTTSGVTNIGTFTPGSPTNDLIVTFGTNITPTHIQAVARCLTYYCTSASPSASPRRVKCHITLTNNCTSGDVTNIIYPTCPTNIETVLIMDKTSSMGTADMGTTNIFGSNRLAAAKFAAISYLNYPQFPADQVRVIAFCGNTNDPSNPTYVTTNFYSDQTSLSNAIAGVSTMCDTTVYPPSLIAAYTNLTAFTSTQTLRLIIFLTDGEQNGAATNWQWAVSEARKDRLARIRLITIGVGGNISSNNAIANSARTLLTLMASSPQDFHVSTNGTGLTGVYSNAAYSACRVANLPPIPDAGPNATNVFNALPGISALTGSVSDDGLPTPPTLTNLWTVISGPAGGAVISTPTNVATAVTFTLPGVYAFQLLASDTQLSATDRVTNTVRELPVVAITNPASQTVFPSGANILIQARAASRDGGVIKVEFFHGNVSLGFITNTTPVGTNSYSMIWSNAPAGNYALTAVATDGHGLTNASASVYITVPGRPSVFIVTPADGDAFNAPAAIRLSSVAHSSDGVITGVTYYTNGVAWSNSTASPYQLVLNHILGGTNSLQLIAVATDNNGVTATSPPVNVTVRRMPPTVTITVPQPNAGFSLGEPITIRGTASDPDGVVTSVQLFDAGSLLGIAVPGPDSIFSFMNGDLGVQFAETRQQVQDLDVVTFSERVGGSRDITLTLPNGPTVTFQYSLVSFGLLQAQAIWTPPAGVQATLQPLGVSGLMLLLPGPYWVDEPNTPVDSYDFPAFLLTTASGTQYYIYREDLGEHFIDTGSAQFYYVHAYGDAIIPSIPAGTNQISAVAYDNDGLSATSTVPISVQGCLPAGVSNLVLSAGQILGGNQLTGTVILSTAATTGGQAVNLFCTSSNVMVPAYVFIPQGQRSNTFVLTTLSVTITNTVTLSASYHGQPGVTAALKVLPSGTAGTVQTAVRPGFDAINSHAYDDVDSFDGGQATGGPQVDIGFPILFYCQSYSNLYVNNNGLITFIKDYGGYVIDTPISRIGTGQSFYNDGVGRPAIAPFWADVDTRAGAVVTYGTNTVDGHKAFGATWPGVRYFPSNDPSLTNIFQVVLIDRSDTGEGNFDIEFNYGTIQWETGDASHIFYPFTLHGFGEYSARFGFGNGFGQGFELPGSGVSYALTDVNAQGGINTNGLIYNSFNSTVPGRYIFPIRCNSAGPEIIVRDDQVPAYSPFTVTSPAGGAMSIENAIFDVNNLNGDVWQAYLQRCGALQHAQGAVMDLELGATSLSGFASSFGQLWSSFQAALSPTNYNVAWMLPASFNLDLQSQLNGVYQLRLTNRVSSLCGDAYSVTDAPNTNWPFYKNILAFEVKTDRSVPQGRCRSFILDTSDTPPLNGDWDIIFFDRIIASSGNPKGWDVEEDHTIFGGFTITAPASVPVGGGYELRVHKPGWLIARSVRFSVAPKGTLNTVPVLLPLVLSSNLVAPSAVLTLAVALDYPAPLGGAQVPIYTNGIPCAVAVIPAGQTSTTVTLQAAGTNGGTFDVMASYNGYRKARANLVTGCAAPDAPTFLIVSNTGDNTVVLIWTNTLAVTSYTVNRGLLDPGLPPFVPLAPVFTGLTTNQFVDADVVPGVSYWYQITAFNNWCTNASPVTSIQTTVGRYPPTPWIIPNGGAFYNGVDVLLTNLVPNLVIYYTTNGSPPSDSFFDGTFVNGGIIHLGTNTIVQAFNYKTTSDQQQSYSSDSAVNSARFTLEQPLPILCGHTLTNSLAATNPFSPVDGWGYYCREFVLSNAPAGEFIVVTADSTNFDTWLYLKTDQTNVLAASYDVNYPLISQLPAAGNYLIEVGSYLPYETGTFSLHLDCIPMAGLNVFTNACTNGVTHFTTNSSRLPSGGLIDFGVIKPGTYATNWVTITNNGNGDLIITNLTIAPAALTNGGNGFSIWPTNVIDLPPNGITNLAVSLYATNWSSWGGYFYFVSSDPNQSFYYARLAGQVSQSGSPWINIDYPPNGLAIPATNSLITNVVLEIDAQAMDEDGIQKVEFYTNYPGTPFRTLPGSPYYTIYWTNPPAGAQTITAKAYDNSNPQQTATTNVTIMVGFPTLTLSPTNACAGLSNTTFTVTNTLRNATNGPVSGSNVTFTVTGAHNLTFTTNTLPDGTARFTYTGTNAGLDVITATASVNSIPVSAYPVLRNWARFISCGNTISGVLTNTDGTSIACGCAIPSHYTDFYSFTTTAGATNTFKMSSSNFVPYLFLMDTNCTVIAVSNELLNTNTVQVRAILPAGTYIVEATSADIFQTGPYSLSLLCGPSTTPHITVSVNGTNFSNYGLLDLGTTTNGAAVTQTIGVTNTGGASLILTNYAWYYGQSNVFSVTLVPMVSLAPGAGTSFTLQFFSTNGGPRFQDALLLTNNDPDQTLFAINLRAVSNPSSTNGNAPTITLTTPTNNAWFYVPAGIPLAAIATPSGVGVTITNVEFGYLSGQNWYFIGRDTVGPAYSTAWNAQNPGTFTLAAAAWDSLGRMAISASVTNIQLRLSNTNHPPKANTDIVTVLCNSHNNVLDVLTNDTDLDGDPLTIVDYKLSSLPGPRGTVKIVDNGRHLSYTPVPGYGTNDPNIIEDGFSYEISDSKGATNWGSVYVVIYAGPMPHIQITNPPDGSTITAGTTNIVSWTNWPPEAVTNIVRVEFYDEDVKIGEVTSAPFTSWPWLAQYDSCQCGLKARVIDKFGQYSENLVHYNIIGTDNPNLPVPYASISSPALLSQSPQVVPNSGQIERNAEVTDGMLVVTGSVYQQIGSSTPFAVEYKVLIKTPDGTILRDSGWQPAALIQNGPIWTNDLTTLQNDSYVVELVARNPYQISHMDVPFLLNTGLKLGVFTFSEQDLVIPAGGVPLSVIRTYNSINPIAGDFGYSWTYALQELNVAFHEDRGWVKPDDQDIDEVGPAGDGVYFSIRTGGSRDLTLTLPNGNRTTFYYYETAGGSIGAFAEPHYYAPPEAHAKLDPVDANGNPIGGRLGLISGYTVWTTPGGSSTGYDQYDFPAYLLTLDDGTQYFIKRGYQGAFESIGSQAYAYFYNKVYNDKASVAWIKLPSGEQIVINDPTTGITGSQFSVDYFVNTNKVRSVYFQRNQTGQISAIMDPASGPNGLPVVKYEYDGETNLVRVLKLQDRTGQGTYATNRYLYENGYFPHYLTKMLDPRGVPLARNLFDDSGKLIGVIDAYGKTNLFVYDLTGQTETVFDRMNNPTTYYYDAHGNVTTIIDALGHATHNTYDDPNNPSAVTSTTDALTNTTYYAYDSHGYRTMVTDPLGHTNLSLYDDQGNLLATTNALGKVTRLQYDNRGNQTDMVDALNNHYGIAYDANNKATAATDPLGRTNVTAAYDGSGNLHTLTDQASVATTTFAYDPNGNQTMSSNLWVNPTNSADTRVVASQSVYDAQGRETSSTDPDGLQSSVTYDSAGRQSLLVDEYQRPSGWIYDARGSLIQISFPDGSISRMVYDDSGHLSVTDDKHLPGAIANGTRTTYDNVGQVIMSERLTNVVIGISPDAYSVSNSGVTSIGGVISTSTYGYDTSGRQVAVTNGFGAVTHYEYDAAGNQTAMTDALGNRTDNIYDEAGRLQVTANALLQITRYEYDALGRLTRTIYPDGSFTGTAYDATGNRIAETNQLGLVTTYAYDEASRLTNILKATVFDPESGTTKGPVWSFVYDTYGQLKSVNDPKQRVTQFSYDQLGRMVSHTLPMNQTASQSYDSFGRTFHKVDFKGQTNEFIYNGIGQLATNQFYAPGSGTPNVLASYSYDSQDRIQQVTEPRGVNVFTYNNQNVANIASPEGTVNYEYEPIDGRRVRTYTANSDLRFGYDLLGRINTVTVVKRNGVNLTVPEVTTNLYTKLGSLQDVFYPNGVHAAYQYDGMNRLTNLVYTAGGGTLLAQYGYAPNTNWQWLAATEIQRQTNGAYATNRLAWNYDNLGRLTNETCGSSLSALNYTNRYVYSLVGNRLWLTNVVGTTTTVVGYSCNNNDQLTQEVTTVNGSLNGTFTNTYDVNGALTNHSSATEQNGYSYNLQNRLASAVINRTDSGHQLSETVNFTYDYKGNRAKAQWSRSVDGGANVNGTNIYLFEPNGPAGNQILEEFPVVGATPTVSYVPGGHTQSKGGVISHLLLDGHGSTRQLADTNGSIAAKYNYDAYGKGLDFTNGVVNSTAAEMLYGGEQLDADLQLYNLRARYYNPVIGRFGQIDPFSGNQQDGVNLYAYAADDPVNNSDPSGMYEIDVHEYLTRYLAQAVGFSDSILIGQQTEALDEDGRDAMASKWLPTDWSNMSKYHFVSKHRLQKLAGKIGQNDSTYVNMGQFLHAQEDTYAHSSKKGGRNFHYYGTFGIFGGGFPLGHVCYGHKPDHTWNDPAKAMMMARKVYEDLKYVKANNGSYPDTSLAIKDPPPWTDLSDINWDLILPSIMVFAWTPAETKNSWPETVTYQGYVNKIRLLYGSNWNPSSDPKGDDKYLLKRSNGTQPNVSSLTGGGYSFQGSDVGGGE